LPNLIFRGGHGYCERLLLKTPAMKQLLCLLGMLCLYFSHTQSQSKYWVRNYFIGDINEAKSINLSDENELILTGNRMFASSLVSEGYILILDKQGETMDTIIFYNEYGFLITRKTMPTTTGYVLTGSMVTPLGSDFNQMFLLYTDSTCNELERIIINNINAPHKNSANSFLNTWNNNYLLVGYMIDETGAWQPYAVKTDTAGNIIWERVYDNYPLLNWLTDIVQAPNEQAYYVIGTVGFNMFQSDILVAKISDATGEMLWDSIYNFGTTFWDYDGKDVGGRMIRSINGGYIAGGAINGFGNEYYKGVVIRFNNSFDMVWYNENIFYDCSAATVDELPNGDIVTTGCNDPVGEYAQMQIIKLSGLDGSIRWQRTYGGSWHDYAYDLALMPDGGFLVAGRQDTIVPGSPVGHASAWVLRLNCMGLLTEPEAAYTYEPSGDNQITFTNQTLYAYPDSIDGGFYVWDYGDGSPPYICGQGHAPCSGNVLTHQYPAPGSYVVTLTAIVCSDTSVVQTLIDTEGGGGTVGNPPQPLQGGELQGMLQVYPNPAQNTLTFALPSGSKSPSGDLGVLEGWQISLFSPTGQTVLQTTLAAGETSRTVSVAHLPEGLYVYVVEQGGSVLARGRVAVMR